MLDEKIENLLNDIGFDGMKKVLATAEVEIFRNYCIHNFNWFKGGILAHDDQHRYEKTWMRFYVDHGRLPKTISIEYIINNKLTKKDIERSLQDIYEAYKKQYKFDIMNPDKNKKVAYMPLDGF